MTYWPDGKKFAFTILDDTDCSTLENVPQVYEFLNINGFRTTKTVWVSDGEIRKDNYEIVGTTCQDIDYLNWVKNLQKQGFEIASHSVTFSSSTRSQIIKGLDRFQDLFGSYPKVLAQHNDDFFDDGSIYWGSKRVSGIAQVVYKLIQMINGNNRNIYFGEIQDSEYFWGDICKERIKYVRNFVYPYINTTKICPYMPYFDPARPYVNFWFSSSEAPDLKSFVKLLSEKNLRKLISDEGACLIYTHFGKGFVKNGVLDLEFCKVMDGIATKGGWYVPVGELLDYILQKNGNRKISKRQRRSLEWKWLLSKVFIGTS